MGVGLGEAAYGGIVVAGSQIVRSGFYIPVLTTVAEGVGVCFVRVALIAKGVVVVGFGDGSGGNGQVDHIAMGVEQVVCCCSRIGTIDEVNTTFDDVLSLFYRLK